MTALADRLGLFLAAWTRGVLARPRLVALAFLGLAVLAGGYAAQRLGVNTDTANMIDASLPWRRDYNDYRAAFPVRDRNLVIVVDAPSSRAADAFTAALLAELRREPELYRSVLLPGEGEFFERNGLLYLPTAELETLVEQLAAAQPLLGLLAARFDGAAVLDVARRTLENAGEGDAQAVGAFHDELATSLAAAAEGGAAPLDWRALLGGAPPTTRRIVVLQPALDFARLQPASVAIEGVRTIAARLNAGAAEPVTVRLTGSVAMEHEELLSVSRGAGLGVLATFVMVALVLYAALRSWRLLAISLVTLLSGLTLTAAFAAAAVGQLNLLSVAFVVLNVGLGSDYVIHVLLRYRELAARGEATQAALVETMRGVGSSLALCAVTTAAGFYSFIPTTFSGVSELGLIAGTGVFFGLFASVTLLPALVAWFGDSKPGPAAATWIDPRFLEPLARRPRIVLATTAVVLVASLVVLPRVTFDSNPIHLRDPRSESVATLLELAAGGEAELLNLVAVVPDRAAAREAAEALRSLPEVARVVTVEQLVPGEQDEKLALLADLELLLGADFAALNRVPFDEPSFDRALEALDTAAADSAPGSLRAATSALLASLRGLPSDARAARLRTLDEALTADLPAELSRLSTALTAAPFTRDALPPVLAERWLAADGRELVEIAPAEDVSDNAAAARFIAAVRGVVPHATGLPVVYQEASATVVGAFERALVYAFAMVSVIIWLVLRRVRDTLLVLLPIALSAVVTAALTVLVDMPFNYANIIALPLLVGIGVDNGIHVVHRMRHEPADRLFGTSTMRAVLASGLTTVASFGNLAFSSHVGTASMGVLLALGLAASMAATLIALPAWLKLTAPRAGVAA
jgi:hopanoid biosynthesis associated RND transporter like protein HpnN